MEFIDKFKNAWDKVGFCECVDCGVLCYRGRIAENPRCQKCYNKYFDKKVELKAEERKFAVFDILRKEIADYMQIQKVEHPDKPHLWLIDLEDFDMCVTKVKEKGQSNNGKD